MGTRGAIAVTQGGIIKAVSVNWDAYPSYVGRVLMEHYDSAKANNLIALGDLSSLGKNISAPEDVEHSFDKPVDDVCVFYGRDRNEVNQEWLTFNSAEKYVDCYTKQGAEYLYLLDVTGKWHVYSVYGMKKNSNNWCSLSVALDELTMENE